MDALDSQTAEAFVSFQGVQKTYDGETLVVRDLNLDVARGEFLTLLGPSGSGKTTTLMMLAGFEAPTQGRIVLAGRELNRLPPHKRNLGMVFQNYALFPHMTVAENLAFPLRVRRIPKAELAGRIDRALDMVHLAEFENRRPGQLSGGQQQRVAVARALVFEPEIVLMDEPLGALDKKLREQLQFEIKSLHDRLGITMVYVTHDQGEALTMSDRIAVFAHGILQQCGPPRRLYEQPMNAFVADFVGENNRMAGTVRQRTGETCKVELDHSGGEAVALAVQDLQPGNRCILSVRPEHVQDRAGRCLGPERVQRPGDERAVPGRSSARGYSPRQAPRKSSPSCPIPAPTTGCAPGPPSGSDGRPRHAEPSARRDARPTKYISRGGYSMSKRDLRREGVLPISRRDLMALGARTAGLVSLTSLGALAASRGAFAAGGTINLCSWGGAYQFSQVHGYEKPYAKKTGIDFNNVEKSANGPALVTAQEQSGNINWDIVDILQAPATRLGDEGMLHTIDFDKDLAPAPDGTPATKDFIPGSLSGDGKTGPYVSTISYSTLFSYNKTAFDKDHPPKTVKDVFDIKNFPGTRALQKIPAGNLEWALYADGVDKDKIYDELKTQAGVDRAFKKLDTIKSHVQWWTQGAQPPQMLAQKEAVIATAFNGRIFNAIAADNQPLDFIWDGGLYEWDGWVIPGNLPKDRLELALHFLRFSTNTDSLLRQAKYIAYSPARYSSFKKMHGLTYYKNPKIEMWQYMPTNPEHLKEAIPKNVTFWSNYGPQLNQRFSAWLAS